MPCNGDYLAANGKEVQLSRVACLLDELDGKLGAFAGRPVKDNWVAQAKHLAAGDVAGFEAQFGKI